MRAPGRDHLGHLAAVCRPPDSFPLQCRRELLLAITYPLVGGVSGVASRNFCNEDLKLTSVGWSVVDLGSRFHSFGPSTEKEESYICWAFLDACLCSEGMTACIPLRSLYMNLICVSFGERLWIILYRWIIIYLSLRR